MARRPAPLRFAANLSTMFQELPVLERPAAAQACGFHAVEFQWPYETDLTALSRTLRALDLAVALINMPLGTCDDDRGIGAVSGREIDFATAFAKSLAWAEILDCRNVRIVCGYASQPDDRAAMEAVLIANLRAAAPLAQRAGVTMLLEPLNAVGSPGYLLSSADHALDLIARAAIDNLALQFDTYHIAMSGNDPLREAGRLAGRYAHVQISDAPGRQEPGTGTIDFAQLFGLLQKTGYAGWIGCEYRPSRPDTRHSLAWGAGYGLG